MRLIAAALVALSIAGAASAQSLEDGLAEVDAQAADVGMIGFAGPFRGSLGDDGTQRFILPVLAGTTVTVAALCDSNCSDLNLKVYDPAGNLVVSDLKANNTPTVDLNTEEDVIGTVEVVMATCARAPCGWLAKAWISER